jgi:hypothetical protein
LVAWIVYNFIGLAVLRRRSILCTACLTDCNIHVQRCEEPLTLSSAAPISVNEHGQDIGLGLRNIGIIWGESAT